MEENLMNREQNQEGVNSENKIFTKDSKFSEILSRPEGVEILMRHGVPCPTCPMAAYEYDILEIGPVCQSYGLDLEAVLEDLNNLK